MNSKMDNEKLTEEQIQFTNTSIYKHCEICKRRIRHTFHPLGQRFRNRYPPFFQESLRTDSQPAKLIGYCHICHKSMCKKCSVGILCKNCIEFFPETTKNKFLALKEMFKILKFCWFSLIIFAFLGLIPIISLISDLGIPRFIFFVLLLLSDLLYNIGFYFIFKYFEDTTENFLKEMPQYHEKSLNEVYALFYDSFDHPENISNLKKYILLILLVKIVGFTFFFASTELLK